MKKREAVVEKEEDSKAADQRDGEARDGGAVTESSKNQSPLLQDMTEPEEQLAPHNAPQVIDTRGAPIMLSVPAEPVLARRVVSGPARLFVAALGLGGMFDALFYEQIPGIGFPLFAILTFGAVVGLALRENLSVNLRAAIIIGAPLLFFAAMVAVRANSFLTFLNIVVSLFLAGLLAHFFTGGSITTLGLAGFLGVPWLSLGNTVTGGAPLIRKIAEDHSGQSEARKKLLPVLRGLLLAIPILAVMVPLLISADAIFEKQATEVWGWLFPQNWDERAGRLAIILGVGWLIAGCFVYALTRQEREETTHNTPARPLGFTEGMTPLVLVCLLFTGFLLVQAEYLFGGSARVQAVPGLTYAEYARRGFGELVTIAVLTLSLALAWQRLMQRAGPAQIRLFKGSLTLLVGLTLVLLASAYQRMSAYEIAYGATETRLYVDAFIVFLGAVLVWFVVTLWTEAQRFFAFGGFLCALGYVASLNLLNPDAAVARTNIARSLAGKQRLDFYTVRGLSDDAVPVLCAALDTMTGTEREVLAAALRVRLKEREEQRIKVGWPSWNISRETALHRLRAHAASLPRDADASRQLNAENIH